MIWIETCNLNSVSGWKVSLTLTLSLQHQSRETKGVYAYCTERTKGSPRSWYNVGGLKFVQTVSSRDMAVSSVANIIRTSKKDHTFPSLGINLYIYPTKYSGISVEQRISGVWSLGRPCRPTFDLLHDRNWMLSLNITSVATSTALD